MENKYYTPELSEFCEDFEFEECVDGKNWDKERSYTPNEFIRDNKFELQEWISDGRIRVKYLDQQDIKECGFTYIGKSTIIKEGLFEIDGWTSYCIRLYYEEHDHRMVIVARDLKVLNEEVILFQGIIKNKTEFKKVLKMLWV